MAKLGASIFGSDKTTSLISSLDLLRKPIIRDDRADSLPGWGMDVWYGAMMAGSFISVPPSGNPCSQAVMYMQYSYRAGLVVDDHEGGNLAFVHHGQRFGC